ncbi:MAG: VCBS repeat-containing protein [Myxococcota bacterium]
MRFRAGVFCLLLIGCSSTPPSADGGTGGSGGGGMGGGGGGGGQDAGPSCDAGLTDCGGRCVDTARNDAHCARCDNACTSAQRCTTSLCFERDCTGAPCDEWQVCFNEACVDQACLGVVCPMGLVCARGVCVSKDCGAMTCEPHEVCASGMCTEAACVGVVCPSGQRCAGGLCVPLACTNGQRDGTETDVDCGGPCGGCRPGETCTVASDCGSGLCTAGRCVPAPACMDTVKSGQETDVDCGGPACNACGPNGVCRIDADCDSDSCVNGRCAGPTCTDAMENGRETDIDCGGDGGCMACGVGQGCLVGPDCTSRVCGDGGVCLAPSCSDSVANGVETDVDCGGDGGCMPCGAGKACAVATDCVSGSCTSLRCDALNCSDTIRNGNETDVDCGGACPACIPGLMCLIPNDCTSRVCDAGTCASPTCNDGVRNGSELGVDCGGNCYPCGLTRPVGYAVGNGPYEVVVADFNADNKQDLAVCSYSSQSVTVLLGVGNGTFQTGQNFNTTRGCYHMKAAEVSGDSNLDLVLATDPSGGDTVQLLLGNGDGTFGVPVGRNINGGIARSAGQYDLNGDGELDVYAGENSVLRLGFGQGNTNFTVGSVSFAPGYAHSVAVGDFTGDGRADFAVQSATGSAQPTVYFIEGQPDGGFPPVQFLPDGGHTAWARHTLAITPGLDSLWAADLNADGWADLVGNNGTSMAVTLNQRDGGFSNAGSYGTANCVPRRISVGDLQGDGGPVDIVGGCGLSNSGLGVNLGVGGGGFAQTLEYRPLTAGSGNGTALGDFNGDGKLDVALTDLSTNQVFVYLNTF